MLLPPSAGLLQQVHRTIRRHQLLTRGQHVLVAVSGGPDSAALFAALVNLSDRLHLRITAAHFDHHLRGAESERDRQVAEELARRLGTPLLVGSAGHSLAGPNLEARARSARYAFLKQVARERECSAVATGHTLDDQAETVLLRVLRGTSLDGLRAIAPRRRDGIIRPLIECRRSAVLDFVREQGLPFAHDSSNDDVRFTRNRLRHQVMPLLEALNPRVRERLATLAELARTGTACIDEYEEALCGESSRQRRLHLTDLKALPQNLRFHVARRWLGGQRGSLRGLSWHHHAALDRLLRSSRPNSEVILPGGGLVVREYEFLRYVSSRTDTSVDAGTLQADGDPWSSNGWRIEARTVAQPPTDWRSCDLLTIHADAAALSQPMTVRPARRGDRIRPFGMSGHRKLHDLFIDRRIPRQKRWGRPVVHAGSEILWVPGLVRSVLAPVTRETTTVLRFIAAPPAEATAG